MSSPVYNENDHPNATTTTTTKTSDLEDQLKRVRSKIRKVTTEVTRRQKGHIISSIDTTKLSDNNASFLLGMDLFGQEPAALEESISKTLNGIEQELAQQQYSINKEITASTTAAAAATTGSLESLQDQANLLSVQIKFLKKCSRSRLFLEEATSWACSDTVEDTTMSDSAEMSNNEPKQVQAARRLLDAGKLLKEAEEIIAQESTSEDYYKTALSMMDAMRHEIRKLRVQLVSKATTQLENSITITTTNISIRASKMLLSWFRVLDVCDEQNVLKEYLRSISQKLMKNIFHPLLKSTNEWKFTESSEAPTKRTLVGISTTANINSSSSSPVHRLDWVVVESNNDIGSIAIDDDRNSSKAQHTLNSLKRVLDSTLLVLKFVASRVLMEQPMLCDIVSRRLLGTPDAMPSTLKLEALGLSSELLGADDSGVLMEVLINTINDTCIPVFMEPSKLNDLQNTSNELLLSIKPFCEALETCNMLPSSSSGRLLKLCEGLQQPYIENRRLVLLNEARHILLNKDYHNTVVMGSEPLADDKKSGMAVFKLHAASVSSVAYELMQLVRTTMDEAVNVAKQQNQDGIDDTSPLSLLAPTLYKTSREMLDLFRAIMLTSQGVEVQTVPRTAAILHNDCVFLAHHCLTLGIEYREQFDFDETNSRGRLVQQTCIFVDMVPLFREMADNAMGDMLERQARQLQELIVPRLKLFSKALESDEAVQEWSDAETALNAGVYHIGHAAKSWNPPILSTEVFSRSMGHLVHVVVTLLTEPILHARDISENASSFCSVLCGKAMDEFQQYIISNEEHDHIWGRFVAVCEFLSMDLAQIERALQSGTFKFLKAQELSHLIGASFAESTKRQALLQTLRQTGV